MLNHLNESIAKTKNCFCRIIISSMAPFTRFEVIMLVPASKNMTQDPERRFAARD